MFKCDIEDTLIDIASLYDQIRETKIQLLVLEDKLARRINYLPDDILTKAREKT